MNGRPVKLVVALLAISNICPGAPQDTSRRSTERSGQRMRKLQGLLFNQDCTDFFWSNTIKAGVDGGALLDRYVDILADAGVTVLMCNTNARKTNYRSGVWEAFWDGYDPDGPDDQAYFKPVPKGEVAQYRRGIHSMWALDKQAVDYPARMIARCRQRGISPWISLRMNDVHYNDNLDHPFHGQFWRDPKYHRGGSMSYYARGLDYAHAEVRDLYRDLIVETLQRHDIDGLELDFMREPYLFHEGAEAEGARILAEWLRGIRHLVNEAAARRGQPIRLGVRVPSHPEVAEGWGLDAAAWAKDDLLDLVVATPRWATLEYDMPLRKWQKLLDGTGVTLAGGLEILHRPLMGGPAHPVTSEQAAGAATAVLAAGADVVYLFNYFASPAGRHPWGYEGYRDTLRAMSSLEELAKLPRRHAITWRDVIGPGEEYTAPLPAEGAALAFDLPTGPAPVAGDQATLEMRIARTDGTELTPPEVLVNEVATTFQSRKVRSGGVALLGYSIPLNALPGNERDYIRVNAADGKPVKVVGLEVCIIPGP